MKRFIAVALTVLLGVAVSGCGSGDKVDRVPVEGTLTIDGKPAGPFVLSLYPTQGDLPPAGGNVGTDGKFILGTYELEDGALVGEFSVEIMVDATIPGGVPATKPAKVKIDAPADGSPVQLEIKLESAGRR